MESAAANVQDPADDGFVATSATDLASVFQVSRREQICGDSVIEKSRMRSSLPTTINLWFPALSEGTRFIKHDAINLARLLKRFTTTFGKNSVLSRDASAYKDGCGCCKCKTAGACDDKYGNGELEGKDNPAARRSLLMIRNNAGKANYHPDNPAGLSTNKDAISSRRCTLRYANRISRVKLINRYSPSNLASRLVLLYEKGCCWPELSQHLHCIAGLGFAVGFDESAREEKQS
ncbi:hypothetical protein HG530_002363 [Fusarium avenaceum]|nr:hypothetical protein HG530_002363 [Fusarium avenaceum]